MTRVLIVLLAFLWMIAEERFSLGSLALGLLLGFVVVLPLRPALRSAEPASTLARTLRLALGFGGQMLVAGGRVAAAVVWPHKISPAWIAVPLEASTDAEIAALSFLITLTPDTTVAEISPDRSTLHVYALFATDPERQRRQIQERIERPLLRVLR